MKELNCNFCKFRLERKNNVDSIESIFEPQQWSLLNSKRKSEYIVKYIKDM